MYKKHRLSQININCPLQRGALEEEHLSYSIKGRYPGETGIGLF